MVKNNSQSNESSSNTVKYPAEYQILIDGSLSLNWSEKLAGMSITTTGGKGKNTTTQLRGELIDQAELFGVLNTLHDMNFHVLKVERLEESIKK